MNHFKIPFLSPFKFVPATSSPGVHFDDAWACEQIKSFEKQAFYKQKWVKADTTPLQVESSIAPETLKLYDSNGVVVKTFSWTEKYAAVDYKIYETTFDVSDMAEGIYYLLQQVTIGAINWKAITEPVHVKTAWPNTMLFRYYNSYNRDDVAWTTGLQMQFRCEAGIMDFNPEAEITDYINQSHDREIIDGVPSRSFKLYIGDERGVAPWVVDLLNRIFLCDFVAIEEKEYCRAGKWEIVRQKNYPLIGASMEIVPGQNLTSLEFADTTPLAPGIVMAYSFETGFFGEGPTVPIIEVEEYG